MSRKIVIDLETKGLIEKGVVPEIICYSYAYYDDAGNMQSGCDIWDSLLFSAIVNDKVVIFHNSSFDRAVLRGHGVEIPIYEDTMLMSYIWNPSADHTLAAWGEELGIKKLPKPWKGHYPTEWSDEIAKYCERDSVVTLVLYEYLCEQFESDPEAWGLYRGLELPYSLVIQEMERTGLYVDVKEAQRLSVEYNQEANVVLEDLQKQFPSVPQKEVKYKRYKDHWFKEGIEWVRYDSSTDEHVFLLSAPLSPSSNAQVGKVLQARGWKPKKYTAAGQVCVDEDTLSQIPSDAGAVAKQVLEYRNKIKLVNTFIKPIFEEHLGADGYVRGNFNQCVTITGRLSSSHPNLQNLDSRIRGLFIAPPGYVIFNGDLSNIEARMVAFLLWDAYGDDSMAQAFIRDEDFHSNNSANWGVPRTVAKTTFFARIYGSGIGRLSSTLGVSYKEAQAVVNKIQQACPNLQRLIDDVVEACQQNGGIIHTLMGRRLVYPDINSSNDELASRARRQVFNALVQGSSADVLKELTLRSMPMIRHCKAKVGAAVHDELLGYVPEEQGERLTTSLTRTWSNTGILQVAGGGEVPIKTEFKIGAKWSETH